MSELDLDDLTAEIFKRVLKMRSTLTWDIRVNLSTSRRSRPRPWSCKPPQALWLVSWLRRRASRPPLHRQ